MTGTERTDRVPAATQDDGRGQQDGLRAVSLLLSGVLCYGGLGFLGDHFLHTKFLLPIGIVLGMAASIFMIIKRYGSAE